MRATVKILMLGVTTALAALLVATPAEAHKRHHRHGHRHIGHHDHRSHHVLVPRYHRRVDLEFRVPARIHRREIDLYRPYFRSRTYYAPHRHDHLVYDFPVRTRRGYVYSPHRYCDGRLFTGGRIEFHGRRVHFGIDF